MQRNLVPKAGPSVTTAGVSAARVLRRVPGSGEGVSGKPVGDGHCQARSASQGRGAGGRPGRLSDGDASLRCPSSPQTRVLDFFAHD